MSKLNLAFRRYTAKLHNPHHPGISGCYRCYRNWMICQGHDTQFNARSAMFPLCEECWQELTPQTRLPYYRQLWDDWNDSYPKDEWDAIEAAVREGK